MNKDLLIDLDYIDIEYITNNYKILVKTLINDCPYNIDHLLDGPVLIPILKNVLLKIIREHSMLKNTYYSKSGRGLYDPLYLDHYLILCYRFANALYKNGNDDLAKVVYYSSRIRCSADIYYKSEIGDYFIPVHPIGTIISPHCNYGSGLTLYQNVLIGPYGITGLSPDQYKRPIIGNGVTIYSNSQVMGDSKIGNNVTISMGTTIIDKDIPDDSKVFTADNGRLIILPNNQNNFSNIFRN